uniref:Centrosomal protein of 162 kDa n=1 Tax=Salarias fasciatus TaxID=181472 RepID=A0A672FTZ1_SALFA
KSLRKTPPIREEEEDPGESSLEAAFLTRETDGGSPDTRVSAVSSFSCLGSVGPDTLEEEEEKARFFSQLEAGASSTIDYSRLNRGLDSTGSTGNLRQSSGVTAGSRRGSSPHTLPSDLNLLAPQEGRGSRAAERGGCSSGQQQTFPTAEELMKRVRLEDEPSRGFSVRPPRSERSAPGGDTLWKQQLRQKLCLQFMDFLSNPQTLLNFPLTVQISHRNRLVITHSDLCVCLQLCGLSEPSDTVEGRRAARLFPQDLESRARCHVHGASECVLSPQLRGAEEARQKQRLQAADPAAEQRLQQLDGELRQQEALIRGYQQENEKLYLQMKAQQQRSRATEDAMFRENQRLLGELASIHSLTHSPVSVCVCVQTNEAKLSRDLHSLQVEKRALEVELQLVKRERELAQVQTASGDRGLEARHQEEVEALKKKLQWFTENQELLDRDAGRLKAATAEVLQLREQVEKLKEEVGRSSEQQRRSRVKAALTAARLQVKELELILRSRNPSSLPALIYAAASAGREEAGVTALLERRVQRLEAELESHDEEAKRSLRSMEQQFDRIKVRLGAPPPSTVPPAPLQKLQLQKQKHEEKERRLREQLESLQQQLKLRVGVEDGGAPAARRSSSNPPSAPPCSLQPPPSPSRHQRHAQQAFAARLERLNQQLGVKTRCVQELQRTVERLQRERRSMLSGPRREPGPPAAPCAPAPPQDAFPSAEYLKAYQPTVFTGGCSAAEMKEQMSSMRAEHQRALDHLRTAHAVQHSSSRLAELSNQLSAQEVSRRTPEGRLLCGLERKIVCMELRHRQREKELQQVIGGSRQTAAGHQSEAERWQHVAEQKSREIEAFRLELDSILDILRHLQRQGGVGHGPQSVPQRS